MGRNDQSAAGGMESCGDFPLTCSFLEAHFSESGDDDDDDDDDDDETTMTAMTMAMTMVMMRIITIDR